jgi:molecular chaperone GrpE
MPARKRQLRLRGIRHEALAALRRVLRETRASDRVSDLESALRDATSVIADAEALIAQTRAEAEHVRRRAARDREQFRATAIEDLLRDLIPVADNFDRALTAASTAANPDAILRGVQMIASQLLSTLEARGVLRLIPAAGVPFDPTHHEALQVVEPTPGQAEGIVVEVIRAGYQLNGIVVRPAAVVITKRDQGAPDDPAI